jgi:predicted MPP superfamily phosphohydrolase
MTETSKINRRRFLKRLGLAGGSALLLGAADAAVVEPHWLRIRPVRIGTGAPVCRFAYFTDLHYKGDRAYVRSVVDAINGLSPDFVLFGGDLIEDGRHLPEALEHIAGITAPVYGVPGNHDYWSRVPFDPHRICFAATGGAWLMNETRLVADGRVNLIGLACNEARLAPLPLHPAAKNIVLMHYPAWANRIEPQGRRCDLMLAGHSHGGQVRLPFIGPLIVPGWVDQYNLGLYQTRSGPLYVNPGIGWFYLNIRFNCRPEVTVFEV